MKLCANMKKWNQKKSNKRRNCLHISSEILTMSGGATKLDMKYVIDKVQDTITIMGYL